MVKVSPISGITYDQTKVQLGDVVAPPYDVISDDEQEKLYNLSSHNIVRLILGKEQAGDDVENNKYTRANEFFREWLDTGVLNVSDTPSIYYCIQNYTTAKGKFVSRKGFIANNYIEEFENKVVLPHEYTMGGPKEDRLRLTKACKANFSQIFMVYSDPTQKIEEVVSAYIKDKAPDMDVTDPQGVQNIVYVISDQTVIETIQTVLKDKNLLIADGHHRYETAMNYRNYMREQNPDWKPEDKINWVMSYYTNLDDENLLVFPTHRIITRKVDTAHLLNELQKYFDFEEYKFEKETKISVRDEFSIKLDEAYDKGIAFGLYLKNDDKYILLTQRENDKVNAILEKNGIPDVLKTLDLSVLHELVITDVLGYSREDQMAQEGIAYIKKEEEAFEAVDNDTAEMVFIMPTPKIKDIKAVSEAGYRMPQKSTYFYPKLLSGLVINPLT